MELLLLLLMKDSGVYAIVFIPFIFVINVTNCIRFLVCSHLALLS